MDGQTNDRWALPRGARVGAYVIDGVIGEPDRFGVAYVAREARSGERVAIREFFPVEFVTREGGQVVIRSDDLQSAMSWGLLEFLNESSVLVRVSHPSIVQVRRSFEANGTGYYAMESISGELLLEMLLRIPRLSEPDLLGILLPLIDGLERAHAEGFLHRDIEPAHIIFRDRHTPVLVDFGAGQNAMRFKNPYFADALAPGYAALEQYSLSGRQGPWTDVHGLAAVAYHLIAGRAPVGAPERARGASMRSAQALGQGRYSRALLEAIDWGLRLDPAQRPPSLGEWRAALRGEIGVPLAASGGPMPAETSTPNSAAGPLPSRPAAPATSARDTGASEPVARPRYATQRPATPVAEPARSRKPLVLGAAGAAALGLGAALLWFAGAGSVESPPSANLGSSAPAASPAPPLAVERPALAAAPGTEPNASRPLPKATGLERLARELMLRQQPAAAPEPEVAPATARSEGAPKRPAPTPVPELPPQTPQVTVAPAQAAPVARTLSTEDAAAVLARDPRFSSVGAAETASAGGLPEKTQLATTPAADAKPAAAGSVSPALNALPVGPADRLPPAPPASGPVQVTTIQPIAAPPSARATTGLGAAEPEESPVPVSLEPAVPSARELEDQVIAEARANCRIPAPDLSADGRLTYQRAQRIPGAARRGRAISLPPVRLPDGRDARFEITPDSCARLVR